MKSWNPGTTEEEFEVSSEDLVRESERSLLIVESFRY